MVLTGCSVLSPVIRIFLSPSPVECSTGLTPTTRRQDHTALPSASGALVFSAARVHCIPAPCVRDDRETPLLSWAGTAERIRLIFDGAKLNSEIQKVGARDDGFQ